MTKKGRLPKRRKVVDINNGFVIRQARLSLGLTMECLADRLCVGKQSVYNWEHGLCAPAGEFIPVIERVLCLAANTLQYGDLGKDSAAVRSDVAVTLREGRRRKGLSQQGLALRVGVSKAAISNYECGRNGLDPAVKDRIEKELNISLV